jgi:hypothetical protein
MRMVRCLAVLAFCGLGVSGSAATQDFTFVGSFANVRQTSSDHCYGWSLELWRYNGRLLGLLDRHQALCGDPPCQVLADISHDRKSGRVSFSAFDMRFNGTLRSSEVSGTLGDERVRMKRTKDPGYDARPDKTLGTWCKFWVGVLRCQGVADLCSSLGVVKQ